MPLETSRSIRVGKSVCGKGVYAARDLPGEQPVGRILGRVIDDPDYTSSYCIDLGDNLSLEPRSPFRYLNHSCTPNCMLSLYDCEYEDGTPAPSELYLETLRPVTAGEELTIDYAWSADGAIPCLCGSSACRGWIVDPEQLPLLLKREAAKQRSKGQSTKSATGKSSKKSPGEKKTARGKRS